MVGGMTETELSSGAADDERNALSRRVGLVTLGTIAVFAAVLHFGSTVFLPLAIATLIAFALSPLVSALRRRGMPQTLAVLTSVTVAFALLGGIFTVMGSQLSSMLDQLPTFQANIIAKLEALQAAGGSSGVMGRFIDMATRINTEISNAMPSGGDDAAGSGPMQVAVVESQSAWRMLQDIVVPIVSPVVTAGLVIVVVIFMLLEREDLRDRFIRLVGSNDLHRTTEILEDAGSRVAQYLLIQLLVNVIYAVPIGVGLWLIGVPNPALWALMTLILRFVPYVGSVIAAAIPLFLAFAVSPDWSLVLWTAALFATVELITSNVVEPWLYGSRTGLSPLAVIIAAIVWTWIWGPMGLILSTPLTVCLVVLGRYLPQFEVFDILFGDEPVLAAHARLYQRLLSGEVVESASRAEEALETAYLADYYQEVGIPALLLAQQDYDRGVLSQAQEQRIAASAAEVVEALAPVVDEERDEAAAEVDAELPGQHAQLVVAGGRSRLDDVAARMLGQALSAEAASVTAVARGDLMGLALTGPDGLRPSCLVLSFLDPNPARASLLIIRRIKRAIPGLRVGVVIWQMPEALAAADGLGAAKGLTVQGLGLALPASTAAREAEMIGADFVVASMDEAMARAFAEEAAKPLADVVQKRPPRRRVRPQVAVPAA
jgi:predicted PurR-regulated permease PerM